MHFTTIQGMMETQQSHGPLGPALQCRRVDSLYLWRGFIAADFETQERLRFLMNDLYP